MAMTKRARVQAVRSWLLPPIVQQVVHCLDTPTDALAFLHAAPAEARDEALDALMTLLTQDEHMWPDSDVCFFVNMDQEMVIKALPALRMLWIYEEVGVADFCRRSPLPPTANVCAGVDDVLELRSMYGNWVPNVTDLSLGVDRAPLDSGVLRRELAACTKLTFLRIEWGDEMIDQGQMDAVMMAAAALWPRLSNLRLFSETETTLQRCEHLVAWLTRPSTRRFSLIYIDFPVRAAKALAHALVASSTLRAIKLVFSHNVLAAFLDPSSPSLSRQLRHLSIHIDADWDYVPSLAAKLSSSAIKSFNLVSKVRHEVTPVMDALPATLRRLKLSNVQIASFPLLAELEYLKLCNVPLTSDAVAGLTAALAASTTLVRLKLANAQLPDDQLQQLLCALPRCLSRQKSKCEVYLQVTVVSEPLLITALAQMRNTEQVAMTLSGGDALNLAACQRLLTALSATSHMELSLLPANWTSNDFAALDAYAALHHIPCLDDSYLSPSSTPWVALA
ncbi:hypothetical protein SPRG_05422 [Saprolegnia parasitica CBS 223.65]|uniref:F-box domain-containing protein n=1 Tax=Saprolegnia parasitica (strain CBS 223.65) TaxID=695850 RepID=A0A067CJ49_SAPPC|nr:hypothetical protein SPRG_05422 [Saprolegnia parasitica CBS 223.65]KDO29180.1 hypothetical protein SPRG_05422 [Saprolegnia parasitica CBS 223.65]|eukprot:XP_012200057.1 hypothetical protein SPRG_05422 [Saprolegnia parasitica CBS 223.65]